MTLDEAYDFLNRAIAAERLAHGYIVEGDPRGTAGDLAIRVASLLMCSGKRKPCGECKGCRQTAERTHPDFFWVEPQKKSRIISVDQMRELLGRISQTSFAGGWKVAALVGADRIGADASNVFLKTLEEPPGMTLFLLLTDTPQALLPTIVSRCQYLALSGDELALRDDWKQALVSILTAHTGRAGIASLVGAEAMARLFKAMKKVAVEVETELAEKSEVEEDDETFDARAEARYRESRRTVMRCMLSWYRDILLLVHGGDPALLANRAQAEILRKKAAGLSPLAAMRSIQAIEAMTRQMDSSLPETHLLATGFGKLA